MDPITAAEIKRRRTFAIISHPDAGKTTLTEKLLLYCGQIRVAGEVKAKANRRKTVSDWMQLEQERGISVSSSVLQFEYQGLKLNLLDTPGHKDFSEDTYRTLMAVDTALMIMDAAKGVEEQTKKLFEVCKLRGLPILTFINKMDREALDPFDLIKQVEEVLGIEALPLTWPVGMGDRFKGVYDRVTREFHLYTSSEKVGQKATIERLAVEPDDPALKEYLDEEELQKLKDELELLDGALGIPTKEDYFNCKVTPVLFGSARSNFGVPTLLEKFKEYSPEPQGKDAVPSNVVPTDDFFSAFVFKIQANMDKAHRDRLAFLRIVSGKFERDMDVKHSRLDKTVRLAHSKQFWGQERETVDTAYAGDILGVYDPGHFKIGDTLHISKAKLSFKGIPQFSPECFARLSIRDPLKRKQLQKGIQELSEEGLVQVFVNPRVGMQDPVLGVVGSLQFDVLQFRLKDEYGVETKIERLPYQLARWVNSSDPKVKLEEIDFRTTLLRDSHEHPVLLFQSQWEFEYTKRNAPESVEWMIAAF
jgi:peptide chain release factor 3